MLTLASVDELARQAYDFVKLPGSTEFDNLFSSPREFYREVARWHSDNVTVCGDATSIASKMFNAVMASEQKRRKEESPINNGSLISMSGKVRDFYVKLAEWHLSSD